jgi:hypothetical protein
MSATSRFAISVIALGLAGPGAVFAACMGPGAPSNTQTKCLTAVNIPGSPLQSYDISWVNPDRAEYYLADRSNAGVDVINTRTLTFQRTITSGNGFKFVGAKKRASGAVINDISGPDGVVSHGKWLYAGDGDSTLKVIDLDAPNANAIQQSINTGGTNRVDEMALTKDGELLLAANNADDPPFATLFRANGDEPVSNTVILTKITVDPAILPAGAGLSMEQPAWDPKTRRFYVSIPIIANNPQGCNFDAGTGPVTCDGGLLVVNPATLTGSSALIGAFDPATNTGVVPLHACGPNGATMGVHDNLLLGCTPANNPSDVTTLVINAKTKNFANIANITGSDEVWFNKGDHRYYTASNRNCKPGVSPCPTPADQAAVLGVIDNTSVLIETVPQSSGSHSVAADSRRNLIFVPQSAPVAVAPGGDTTTVGAQICGNSTNGCVAVYQHRVDDDGDRDDRGDH